MSVRGKQVQNGTYEFEYMRVPDTRTRWEIFRDGIYNAQEGTYCGHPPKKWGMTLIFYACFYAGLALLFSICMKGMLATLSYEKPKWTLSNSIIGTNPGLEFRPISENPGEKSLIRYNATKANEIETWTKRLDSFFAQYINSSLLPNAGRNQQICNYNTPAKTGNVCAVEVNNWGPCSPNKQYGFNNSSPCVFIKLNRIYGWVPEYYNDTQNLPADMPESLVTYIKKVDASWLNTVWVSCKEKNPPNQENIEFKYFPEEHGFPGFYYPYENIPGYLSPVVAVQFIHPTRIVNVECRAWAKNIHYSSYRSEKKGAVHFEIMVDE